MRLLIVGWHGQIARALVEAAPRCADIEAFAAGRPAIDLMQPGSIARAMTDFGPNVIINAAAYTAVDKAESEQELAFKLNSEGARLLAQAAAKRGAIIIHLSTDYVFDGMKVGPYVEDDITSPLNTYGRSKLEGEVAVRAANPRHIIVRTAWVHSATGQNFVKTMLRLGREKTELSVVDDHIGNPTYAPHLANLLIDIARQVTKAQGDTLWGTLHAAGTGETSWCGLAREVFRISAEFGGPAPNVRAINSSEYPTLTKRPANSRLDCSKLARTFALALPDWRLGVREGVGRLLAQLAVDRN
jgi:dTDP-4-dehydrorhamnose reductase